MKDEPKVSSQKDEEKKESKLAGDSGYDCNYCHDKNHFAKDCMLRKMAEKREGEDDEAYYMWKLEEVKKKKASNSSMNALIVQENAREDEFGGVEVWSTDFEDEEYQVMIFLSVKVFQSFHQSFLPCVYTPTSLDTTASLYFYLVNAPI